jgi:hypothetical protein
VPASIYLNETDLLTLGVVVDDPGDWLDGPSRSYPTVAIPGRQGVVFAGDPTTEPRTLQVTGTLFPAGPTLANRTLNEKKLKALAYRALSRLVFDDTVNPPIAIDGVCTKMTIRTLGHPQLGLVSRVSLTLLCGDPTWYDVSGQVISFNATPQSVPLGTAPSGGLVKIAAPSWSANVVNPVLTYYSAAQVALFALTFTVTLTAGTEAIEVDLDRSTIVKVTSGVRTNGTALLTAGDFFTPDPMDGDSLAASYPLLGLSASAGTPSGTWLGIRRWL